MNLYLISQDVNNGYDTFDSAVVAAENEDGARETNPCVWGGARTWAHNTKDVAVVLIGTAKAGTEAGVVLASFNAG